MTTDATQPLGNDVVLLVDGCNQFAVWLFSAISEGHDNNVVCSPSSLSFSLAMTLVGARGETANEITNALMTSSLGDRIHEVFGKLRTMTRTGGVELHIATRIWAQQGYKALSEFLTICRCCYEAGLEDVDFRTRPEQARQSINDWVASKTGGKIAELIGPGMLDRDTRLVLTNAVYFLGTWEQEFDSERTVEAPFFVNSEKSISVPMMEQTNSFGYGDFDDLQVLEMPFRCQTLHWQTEEVGGLNDWKALESPNGGSDFAMCVLLPRPHIGLADIERQLSMHTLQTWTMLPPFEVHVQLPRFRMESGTEMSEPLKQLGIRKAFSESEANFSGMTTDPEGLFIRSVAHKAFVDVNEKGTEAAAATAIFAYAGGAKNSEAPKEFRADRPFLFVIRDWRTNLIHFVGRVSNPTSSHGS